MHKEVKVRKSTNIQHIIFDLGEVLLTGTKNTGLALKEKHNLEIVGPKMDWAQEKHPLLIPLIKEFFHGKVSEDEYIKGVITTYPQIGNEEWLKKHIRENFREVEGTRKIVVELKRLRYSLALLSVHAKEWIDYCEKKFDFHGLFDTRVYSFETGVSKPHPLSFQAVLTQLGTTADKCLFIDDSPINTAAAEKLGFSTVLFTNAKDLRMELSRFLPDFS